MKNLLFILLCIATQVSAASYEDIRNEFMRNLYNRQQGLMTDYKKYQAIIEPYLQRAENELQAALYCKQNPGSELSSRYLFLLAHFISMNFNQYAIPALTCEAELASCEKELLSILEEIKQTESFKYMNVAEEFRKTKHIFSQANVAYYKKLGFSKKIPMAFLSRIL